MQSPSLKRTARRREFTLASKRCTPTATVVRSPPSTSASPPPPDPESPSHVRRQCPCRGFQQPGPGQKRLLRGGPTRTSDRKSTRLNSSHVATSYAVFCFNKETRSPLSHSRL